MECVENLNESVLKNATHKILQQLVNIASQKEWGNKFYSPEEIVNKLTCSLDFDKIDKILLTLKKNGDTRFVNIITCRKIVKNDLNCTKFFFNDAFRLCCPRTTSSPNNNEELWEKAIERFESLGGDDSSDYSDYFDWASDETMEIEISDPVISKHWGYIH